MHISNASTDYCTFDLFSKAKKNGKTYFALPTGCNISRAIIVMSESRSGSSFWCDVISHNLKFRSMQREIFGSHPIKMETLPSPILTMKDFLCSTERKAEPHTGFKWKPEYWSGAYVETLQWVAYHKIPVVYNTRNPIDKYLSVLKHRNEKKGEHLSPHCKNGNFSCVAKHIHEQLQHLDPAQLLEYLTNTTCDHHNVRRLLDQLHVRHLSVSFEHLSIDHCDNATAVRSWRRVFEFIEPQLHWNQTRILSDDLLSSMVATSSVYHRDKIENYNEIKAALRDTQFARLLN